MLLAPPLYRDRDDGEEDLAVRNVVDALSPYLGPLELAAGTQPGSTSQVRCSRMEMHRRGSSINL